MAGVALASIGLLAWLLLRSRGARAERVRSMRRSRAIAKRSRQQRAKTCRRGNDLAFVHPPGALLAMPWGRN